LKNLLVRKNLEVLAQLAWANVLLAFDFDGTLAPIVRDRDAARMRRRTAELFSRACDLYPCAVLSGRSRADVRPRLEGARVKYVVGNHGLEPGARLSDFEEVVAALVPVLEASFSGLVGIDVEDKRYSIAIHYRRARRKGDAREVIRRAIGRLDEPVRVIPGKLVVNVVPSGAPNKGDALVELRAKEGADTALYVGDDVTDEDVFTLDQPGRLLGVRVGERRGSAAEYFVERQRDVDRLLSALVGLRAERRAS
jgi:trehalose 6-phosphate phosphatase